MDGRGDLWYARPAAAWVEALPVGNGRLGAMAGEREQSRSGATAKDDCERTVHESSGQTSDDRRQEPASRAIKPRTALPDVRRLSSVVSRPTFSAELHTT